MFIGIDETGNFDPNSTDKQFFTAISVDQNRNKHSIKEKQFLEWESVIPEKNRDPKSGEVKGRFLLPDQIHDFFYEVLIKPPRSFFTVLEFDPTQNPAALVENHKQWNLDQMNDAMLQHRIANQPNSAKRWLELIAWYRKSNYQRVVKIESLQTLYFLAFQHTLLYAQILFRLDGSDDSNFKLRFNIDQDFIRSPLLRNFWDIHFYKSWQVFTRTNPTPFMGDDPEIEKAIKKHFSIEGQSLLIKDTFYDHTTFVDSKSQFEVRLADVFGNILHRYHNKGQCEKIWEFIVNIIKRETHVSLYTKVRYKRGDPPAN